MFQIMREESNPHYNPMVLFASRIIRRYCYTWMDQFRSVTAKTSNPGVPGTGVIYQIYSPLRCLAPLGHPYQGKIQPAAFSNKS